MINETTPTAPTVYAMSRRLLLCLLLVSLAFTGLSVLMLGHHATFKGLIGGLVGPPVFGTFSVLIAIRLIRNRPELVLDAHGLEHAQLGRIAWAEIAAVRIREQTVRSTTQRMIEVVLYDPAAYLARAPRTVRATAAANRALGYGPANIPATSLSTELEDVLAAMHRHHPRLGGHAG